MLSSTSFLSVDRGSLISAIEALIVTHQSPRPPDGVLFAVACLDVVSPVRPGVKTTGSYS